MVDQGVRVGVAGLVGRVGDELDAGRQLDLLGDILPALREGFAEGRPAHVLDVGTGTGILAFAAAKALHGTVVAGDLDDLGNPPF